MKTFTEYVVGFLFSSDKCGIVLIEKQRPVWQFGLLNGVGGHIHDGEAPVAAMVRECHEECGAFVPPLGWINIAVLTFPVGRVHFFCTFDDKAFVAARTITDEKIHALAVGSIHTRNLVRNLHYLIPLCLHYGADLSGSKLQLPVQLIEVDALP